MGGRGVNLNTVTTPETETETVRIIVCLKDIIWPYSSQVGSMYIGTRFPKIWGGVLELTKTIYTDA